MNKLNKKSIVAALMIMVGMTVFASGTGEVKDAFKVVPKGDVFHLYYSGVSDSRVKLVIKEDNGNVVYRESIGSMYSFKRGYDLSQLPYGSYEFKLTTGLGTMTQTVEYVSQPEVEIDYLTESLNEEGTRQLVHVPAGQGADAKVVVLSTLGGVLYQEVVSSEKEFFKIFRLEKSAAGEELQIIVKSAN